MKISALPTATTPLSGAELFPLVQSGNTRRVTLAQLAASLTSVGTLSSLTVSGNSVFGPENGRSVDTSYIRVFGGTIATGGANLLIFGNSHPSAPGRAVLSATGAGYAELATFAGSARLDASGNFGLGVTPSAWNTLTPALQLGGGGAFIAAQTTTPALYAGMNAHFNGTNWVYKVDGTATYALQFNGAHSWYTAASGTAGNAITFTQAMTLDANGRLGIATATPVNPLSVIGNVGIGAADFTASAYLHANPPSGANRNIAMFSVAGASNGMQIIWDHASTTLRVILNNIPTSSAGLAAGTLWNDSGTIKIA
jgi:hypothetical protein